MRRNPPFWKTSDGFFSPDISIWSWRGSEHASIFVINYMGSMSGWWSWKFQEHFLCYKETLNAGVQISQRPKTSSKAFLIALQILFLLSVGEKEVRRLFLEVRALLLLISKVDDTWNRKHSRSLHFQLIFELLLWQIYSFLSSINFIIMLFPYNLK